MDIDQKLTRLAKAMTTMAENDMGDLNVYEAALFHTACDAIRHLIEARATADEDIRERIRMPDGSLSASRFISLCDQEDKK